MSEAPVCTLADLVAAQRGLATPFVLACRVRLAADAEVPVIDAEVACEEVLRHLPGRRLVVRARYRGTAYALKLFFGPDAGRYLQRETDGLAVFQASGVRAPQVLAELTLVGDGPGFGVATEWLADTEPVSEADDGALLEVVAALGRLHAYGALRTDPHLRNYLKGSDGGIYVIDGDGVRGCRKLSERRARANLAQTLAQLPPASDERLPAACQAYAQARWQRSASPRFVAGVHRALARERDLRTRRYLRKTLRECSEFHCERNGDRFVACARDAWSEAMQRFAADPEATFSQAELIKAGNSATVIRACIGERPVVVKRYNVKNPWHGLRRALRRFPRYRVAWRNGHRMDFLRLPTARPIALLEVKRSVLRTVAYLVTEDCGSRDLQTAVAQSGAEQPLVEQVVAMFRKLSDAGLTHGDTKATNFLLAADGLRLIDLDAMKPGRSLRKDVRRFLANWDQQPQVRARFADALQGAGMPL